MSWAETQTKRGGGGQIDETLLFMKPNTTTIVHILLKQGEEPLSYWTHYVNGRNIICPGKSICPVCKAGKYKSRKKHAMNVWDYASSSIKILEQGNVLMQQLKMILDQYKTFESIDIAIRRIGEGRDTQYMGTPVPMTKPFTLTPQVEKERYNLAHLKTPTTPKEIEEILQSTTFNPASFDKPTQPTAPQLDQVKVGPEISKPLILGFGKYIGKSLEEVAKTDITYVKWCAANISDFALRAEAQRVIESTSKISAEPEPVKTALGGNKATLISEVYNIINNDERYKNNFALIVEKMKIATRSAINPNGKTLIQDYTEAELSSLLEQLK